jgi:tetratricopeptide (TPR) repeat protein
MFILVSNTMKILIVLAALAISAPATLAETAAQKAEQFYLKGIAAEKAGDPAAAIAAYQAALKLHPGHANARFRAGQVKIQASTIKSSATEAKIGGVMIPAYQIEEATVAEAISALGLAIEKASENEVAPNFVIQDTQGKLTDARITMQLKNVPAKAILDYIHSQANTRARFDEHAVVIMAR